MERRKRRVFLFILIVFCLFSLAAGVILCVPYEEASAQTFFGLKDVKDLRKADPADIAALPKYSSRDYCIVTTLENQGAYNLCWAFATIAASETSILREGVGGAVQSPFFDLEERTLAYRAHNPMGDPFHLIDDDVEKGDGTWNKGGYVEVAGKAMLQWMGPTSGLDYKGNDETAVRAEYPLAYKLEGMSTVKYSVENVKRLVAEYGAAAFSFPIHNYANGGYDIDTYFNNVNQSGKNPHACAIIGWDDTIPASRFTPDHSSGNGGWIVKNSWGSGRADEGYFYLSYDSTIYDIWAFDYTTADAFDNQYYYDGTLRRGNVYVSGDGAPAKAAAIYRAQGGTSECAEQLNAVNIGVAGENVTVDISVYKGLEPNFGYPSSQDNDPEGGKLVARISKTAPRDGFYTFYLDDPVPLENGDAFSVVVEAQNAAGNARIFASVEYNSANDMTFECKNGVWSNLMERSRYCAHIRAYTKNVVREIPLDGNDLQFAEMALEKHDFVYTGAEFMPQVTVTLGGKTLAEGRDYRLAYENNLNALSNACAIAVGQGEYCGTCRAYFRIARAKKPPNMPVKDREQPIVVGYEITELNEIPLPDGWEWYYNVDLTKHACDEPLEWTIKYPVTDGNYETNGYDADTGERYVQAGVYVLRESVRHDLVPLAEAEVVVQGIYSYTGKIITPNVAVNVQGKTLAAGIDYVVKSSAVYAGSAEATIEGLSRYTGSKRFTFTIERAQEPPNLAPFGRIEITEEMQTLADVELPNGWRWVDPGAAVSPGKMTAQCEYVGADAENYAVRTRAAELEFIEKQTATDESGSAGETSNTEGAGDGSGGDTVDAGSDSDTGEVTDGDTTDMGDNSNDEVNKEDVERGGLSPATIAGISIGGAAGVGLVALAVILLRRRLL